MVPQPHTSCHAIRRHRLSAKKVSDRTPQELKVVSGHFLTLSGTRDMDQLTGAKSSDFFFTPSRINFSIYRQPSFSFIVCGSAPEQPAASHGRVPVRQRQAAGGHIPFRYRHP
jgi:hypothetical protein